MSVSFLSPERRMRMQKYDICLKPQPWVCYLTKEDKIKTILKKGAVFHSHFANIWFFRVWNPQKNIIVKTFPIKSQVNVHQIFDPRQL